MFDVTWEAEWHLLAIVNAAARKYLYVIPLEANKYGLRGEEPTTFCCTVAHLLNVTTRDNKKLQNGTL